MNREDCRICEGDGDCLSCGVGSIYDLCQKCVLVSVVLICGCASTPWSRADCTRYRYPAFNVLVCNDQAVDSNCQKWTRRAVGSRYALDDNGNVIGTDYSFRACAHVAWFGRKPYATVGRSYPQTILHELGHILTDKPQSEIPRLYPVEDQ